MLTIRGGCFLHELQEGTIVIADVVVPTKGCNFSYFFVALGQIFTTFCNSFPVNILERRKSGKIFKQAAKMSLTKSCIMGKNLQGYIFHIVIRYEINTFPQLRICLVAGMVHLYLCHMVIVQELPNNKKVATQYQLTLLNLGARLYQNIF